MAEYPLMMSDEKFAALCGEKEGGGTARTGFGVPSDLAVFIKKVHLPSPGTNYTEWLIWHSAVGTDLEPLLARCISISESGHYLMMERADDITEADYKDMPHVPVWLQDIKPSAFGRTCEGVKIRDYGMVDRPALLNQQTCPPPKWPRGKSPVPGMDR